MLQLYVRLGSVGLSLCVATASFAEPPTKAEPNIEAVRAAADPANGPPIAEATWGPGRFHDGVSPGGPGGYFPERAQRLGARGVAVIRCGLALDGRLLNCTILAEGPTTYGFGEASLAMAKDGRLKAKPPANFSEGGDVRVVVDFKNNGF